MILKKVDGIEKHTISGVVSLIFSIIGIGGIILGTAILNSIGLGTYDPYGSILIMGVATTGFIAIPLGAIAYWSKEKDNFGLFGLIAGIVSLFINGFFVMIAIFSSMH